MSDITSRPDLHGLTERERTICLAHWWLWRLVTEHHELVPLLYGDCRLLLEALEAGLSATALHRLAVARNSYWQERPKS